MTGQVVRTTRTDCPHGPDGQAPPFRGLSAVRCPGNEREQRILASIVLALCPARLPC